MNEQCRKSGMMMGSQFAHLPIEDIVEDSQDENAINIMGHCNDSYGNQLEIHGHNKRHETLKSIRNVNSQVESRGQLRGTSPIKIQNQGSRHLGKEKCIILANRMGHHSGKAMVHTNNRTHETTKNLEGQMKDHLEDLGERRRNKGIAETLA